MTEIVMSEAVGAARLPFSVRPVGPDAAWSALAASFREGLEEAGLTVRSVVRPEIYQTAASRLVAGFGDDCWHLAVKPVRDLRPLPGVPNVYVAEWPYAEVPGPRAGAPPFSDIRRILRQATAVIGLTERAAETLAANGVERVVTLPPPGPRPEIAPRARMAASGARHLVTTPGPGLERILAGYEAALGDGAALRLSICGETGSVPGALASGATVTTGGSLADALADADFFIASGWPASFAPAVAAALSAGVPCLVPSGMGGRTEGLRVFDTEAVLVDAAIEPLAIQAPLTAELPLASGVRDTILSAAALDEEAWRMLGAEARRQGTASSGQARFEAGLERLRAVIGR